MENVNKSLILIGEIHRIIRFDLFSLSFVGINASLYKKKLIIEIREK